MKVLFVCLGNICRSPTAEAVARRLLAIEGPPGLELSVASAGTGDWHVGDPPDARSQRAARARGFDLADLRARQLDAADFEHFDLILAMDRENLATLEERRPARARARCALFLEYAGIAATLGRAEVPDPYAGAEGDFEQVLDLVIAAARALITRLAAEARESSARINPGRQPNSDR